MFIRRRNSGGRGQVWAPIQEISLLRGVWSYTAFISYLNFSSCRLHSDWISRNRLGNWDFCVGHQLEYRSRDRRWNLQQRLSRLAPNRSALIASKFKAKDFGAETVTMVSNFEWGGPQIWYSKRYLITLEDEQFSLKTVGALLSNPCTLFVNVLCLARHYLDISADLKS